MSNAPQKPPTGWSGGFTARVLCKDVIAHTKGKLDTRTWVELFLGEDWDAQTNHKYNYDGMED